MTNQVSNKSQVREELQSITFKEGVVVSLGHSIVRFLNSITSEDDSVNIKEKGWSYAKEIGRSNANFTKKDVVNYLTSKLKSDFGIVLVSKNQSKMSHNFSTEHIQELNKPSVSFGDWLDLLIKNYGQEAVEEQLCLDRFEQADLEEVKALKTKNEIIRSLINTYAVVDVQKVLMISRQRVINIRDEHKRKAKKS